MAFKASLSSQHQHCTDEAPKAETVSALVTFSFVICRFARMPSFQYPCSLVAQFSEEVYKNAGASDVLPLVMGSLDADKLRLAYHFLVNRGIAKKTDALASRRAVKMLASGGDP